MINHDLVGISPKVKGKVKRLRKWPEDSIILHTRCDEVENFDEELHQQIADLFVTLEKSKEGISLAANQAGIRKRIFVALFPRFEEIGNDSPTATPEYEEFTEPYVFVNPRIVNKDYRYAYKYKEGCLSIPGYYESTTRVGKIDLEYFDANGNARKQQFNGITAFAIQHEMDHLDGKLFIDGSSRLKINMIRKKVKKKQKPSHVDLLSLFVSFVFLHSLDYRTSFLL